MKIKKIKSTDKYEGRECFIRLNNPLSLSHQAYFHCTIEDNRFCIRSGDGGTINIRSVDEIYLIERTK